MASSQETTSRAIKKIAMRFIVFVFFSERKAFGFRYTKIKKNSPMQARG
jgi:hypothetical protein